MNDASPVARIEGVSARYILVMGVAGTGKSEVAGRLAYALGGSLVEADAHHARENVERIRQGVGLTDTDRWPWLEAVAQAVVAERVFPVVIACSALKRSYRDFLRAKIGAFPILHLTGSPDVIAERLVHRRNHFATVSLLDSQLRTLEPPAEDEDVAELDILLPPDDVVASALVFLSSRIS